MMIRQIFLSMLSVLLCSGLQAQNPYKMSGPYEIVARDGQYGKTKGGSERDMWQAWQCAKAGLSEKALEIINAYAATLQRFDGHDAALCGIQAYWLVRAMTLMKQSETPAWSAMIRRAMLPVIDKFDADSPFANGNWGAIVNRLRMACAIFLEDKALYQALPTISFMPTTMAHCPVTSVRQASVRRLDVTRVMHSWDLEHSARRARWHGSRVTTYGGLWTTA